MDQTTPQQRSWIGWYTTTTVPDPLTLPPNGTWATIDSFNLVGNWMVCANGSVIPVELMSLVVE